MNWIKVRTNLVRDGRVVFLAIKLKSHPVFICGALCWLWSCADEQTTDGKLHGYTPDYIDFQVNIPGFTMALTELTKDGKPSPWVIVTPEYVGVCEFAKHNGKTAKKRAQAATRASRKRHADSVTPALRSAHLDKNREDKKTTDQTKDQNTSCPDPAVAGLDRRQAIDWDATGGWSGIGEPQRKAWAAAYPSVDIDGELAKATAWLIANPTRAGKRNWARFLNAWLGKSHERGEYGGSRNPKAFGQGQPNPDAQARRASKAAAEFQQSIELTPRRYSNVEIQTGGSDAR